MTVSCRSKSTASSRCWRLGVAALGAVMALLPSATLAQAAAPGPATSGIRTGCERDHGPGVGTSLARKTCCRIVFWRDKDMSVDVIVRSGREDLACRC